jgi:hypothetical protein
MKHLKFFRLSTIDLVICDEKIKELIDYRQINHKLRIHPDGCIAWYVTIFFNDGTKDTNETVHIWQIKPDQHPDDIIEEIIEKAKCMLPVKN